MLPSDGIDEMALSATLFLSRDGRTVEEMDKMAEEEDEEEEGKKKGRAKDSLLLEKFRCWGETKRSEGVAVQADVDVDGAGKRGGEGRAGMRECGMRDGGYGRGWGWDRYIKEKQNN